MVCVSIVLISGCATAPSKTHASTLAPTNFVLQVLEPTGGKILRPKDWFYKESHSGQYYVWILSREDASKAAYTTGVKIQTIVGVKKTSGQPPKESVQEFLQKKQLTADKVVNDCSENNQGLFTRVCIETEEGPYHILYSVFWGNQDLDIVVVSIAGTTKELWDTYAPVFNVMSGFEMIDMKRFEK